MSMRVCVFICARYGECVAVAFVLAMCESFAVMMMTILIQLGTASEF